MPHHTRLGWCARGLKIFGAFAAVMALSGCIVAPYGYGPRYGYYHPRHYGYYY